MNTAVAITAIATFTLMTVQRNAGALAAMIKPCQPTTRQFLTLSSRFNTLPHKILSVESPVLDTLAVTEEVLACNR